MEGERKRRSRRRALVLLVLVLLGALLVLLLRRGEKPGPEKEAPGAPAAEGEEQDLPPARGTAHAVLIRIEASDELPFVMHRRGFPSLADGVALVEDDDLEPYVLLSREVVQALAEGKSDGTIETGVRRPDELGVVVVTEIAYGGRGRHGAARRVVLASELPPFSAAETPDAIRLTPEKGVEVLDAVLPLPSVPAWTIEDGGLRVGGKTLSPGEEIALAPAEARVKLTELRYKPIPRGPEPAEPFATEELDLGEALFRCRVRVRFLGEVKVRVEAEG